MNLFEKYYDVVYDMHSDQYLGTAMREVIIWAHTIGADVDQLNNDLCDAVFNRLDTHLIVTTLRSTYMIRQHLECWNDKVNEAELILTSRGLDAYRLLSGLRKIK